MNDRYLYKAKRTDTGEWVEGDLVHSVYKIDDVCVGKYGSEVGMYQVDPSTICQCTAIPDRDKKIMYENDVVRTSGGVLGVIRFGRYGDGKTDYGFYIEWEKSQPYWRNDIYYWQSELRVVGSFIDNPELLEVE